MLSTTDIHRWLDGSEFKGERLVVQFARGSNRPRDGPFDQPRMAPRPRRTVHRMTITGLPFETSWQVSYIPSLLPRRYFFAMLLTDLSWLGCPHPYQSPQLAGLNGRAVLDTGMDDSGPALAVVGRSGPPGPECARF